MAETPKFEVNQMVRTKPMKVVSVVNVSVERPPKPEHIYYQLENTSIHHAQDLEPAPLLPSSDEFEKLLERLDAFANTLGDEADDINTVILEVMRLQSELASLRAHGDAAREALEEAWESVNGWGAYASDYFKEKHDLNGDLERIKTAIRAITRPTTPSPDEEKKNK